MYAGVKVFHFAFAASEPHIGCLVDGNTGTWKIILIERCFPGLKRVAHSRASLGLRFHLVFRLSNFNLHRDQYSGHEPREQRSLEY